VALVPHPPFWDRSVVYNSGLYVTYADALAGTPGGRARLDTLNTQLRAATVPPASRVAEDSAYVRLGESWANRFQYDMAMTANLASWRRR
jgi:hypothetical protein